MTIAFGPLEIAALVGVLIAAVLLRLVPAKERMLPAGLLVAMLVTLGAFMLTQRGSIVRTSLTRGAMLIIILSLGWAVVDARKRPKTPRNGPA